MVVITPVQKKIVDARDVAAMVGISVSTLKRHLGARKFIPGFLVGGLRRWVVAEVESYLEAGCPSPAEWDAMKAERTAK